MKNSIHRRDILKFLGVGAAGGIASQLPIFSETPALAQPAVPAADAPAKPSLRIAHLTDIHIQPERGAAEGLAQCLRHVQSQKDKPDLILLTGDCVMDSYKQQRPRTQLQWDLWKSVIKAECSLPIMPLLGNHDIWGWDKTKSGTTGTEPGYGKKWACEMLGLDKPYYSYDRAGWHFIMLDSVEPFDDKSYLAKLDDEQLAWLASDLAANVGKPTMVGSHIPIFSITTIMEQKPDDGLSAKGEHNTLIPQGAMHTDWREIKSLFRQHSNVKLAVSGHIHLVDRVDYLGVSYLCNGAVSGGWWKGKNMGEGDAGYAMVDLFDDGRFISEYVNYGWAYRPEATTAPANQAARV